MTNINYDEKDEEMGNTEAQNEALDTQESTVYSDDVSFESEEDLENPALSVKKLRERLRKCEDEKKEYLDGWQRMRADFANARKEEEVRRGDIAKFASESLVEDLLPVLDSFGMAFGNREAWEKVDANWRKGVEYIYAQLFSVLEARGLAEIGALGEVIDPRNHIAIEGVPVEDQSKIDTVVEVIQKGYRLHHKVIRPAKVKAGIVKEPS